MKLLISRFDPEHDAHPRMQDYEIEPVASDVMLLDVPGRLKTQDNTLSLRKSCREGVCESDAMNINGRNGLACITRVRELREPVVIRPLPGFPIIRDLFVDMTQFFNQYHSITPYLINDEPPPERERLQSPAERDKLNGAYECILCSCCTSQALCPRHDEFKRPTGCGLGIDTGRSRRALLGALLRTSKSAVLRRRLPWLRYRRSHATPPRRRTNVSGGRSEVLSQ